MHDSAYSFVVAAAEGLGVGTATSVLDTGGRDINGSVRPVFPNADTYHVLDIRPGDGVDIVADAATWSPERTYEVVVSTEVFEHTADWPAICATARAAVDDHGAFILTAACNPRMEHSAIDEQPIRPDEFYENIDPGQLRQVLEGLFGQVHVEHHERGDVYAWARP